MDDEDARCCHKDVKNAGGKGGDFAEHNAFKEKTMLRYLVFRILFPLVTGLIIKHIKLRLKV